MRIVFQSKQDGERKLLIPQRLLLNRMTAALTTRILLKNGICFPVQEIRTLAKSINLIRKRHPDWVLLEAEDADGRKIKIII